MKIIRQISFLFIVVTVFMLPSCNSGSEGTIKSYDLCVYGGTSAGVIAAHTAAKMDKKVIIIEPSAHLGGMSASGLGSTDIGNKYAVQGLARKFYRDLGEHYGNFENWTFEPKVAEALFEEYASHQNITVMKNHRIVDIEKNGTTITSITLENVKDGDAEQLIVGASQFLDCTYEADLMAAAGVSYFVGREDNKVYGETINGVQLRNKHQFPDGIDPYVDEGNPESGLLPGINPEPVQPNGTGDDKLQAFNYRLCLTNNEANRIPFPKPTDYDPLNYELLWRVMKKNLNLDENGNSISQVKPTKGDYDHYWQWQSFKTGFIIQYMPDEKTDFNHLGGFSIDYIGQNHDYPEASYARRAEIFEEHKQFILGIFHFLKTDPRVPQAIKEETAKWGLPKDEFLDNGGWPHYLYVRETRRMIGEYVMTEANCVGDDVVEDPIALAAYTMDSHNTQRVVVNGMVKNEGNVEVGGFGPYPISYRSLTPKREEVTNLLVPVCLSSSHIAFGSIRMEPVFMVLGQIAAYAAVEAFEKNTSVQAVDYKDLVAMMNKDPYLNGTKADITIDDLQADLVAYSKDLDRKEIFMKANGSSYLYTEKTKKDSEVSFNLAAKGKYEVRYFVPSVNTNRVDLPDSIQVNLQIAEKSFKEIIPIHDKRGKFVRVGNYILDNKETATLSARTLKPGDPLIADAILLVSSK